MNIVVAKGAQVDALLADGAFRERWDALLRACPWATRFQSSAFVAAWSRSYTMGSEPVLAYSMAPDGTLAGLLPLGMDRLTRTWHVAGAHQAEYQTWLAMPDGGDAFIDAALATLKADYGLRALEFRYLPPGAPLTWTKKNHWRRLCTVERRRRPLMLLGESSQAAASLKKTRNRNRLNRLKRKGTVRLAEMTTKTELAAVLPEIETLYDLRMGALRGSTPFHDDPCKRDFHLALMETPDLLHVSTLLVDDRVVAAHIGVREKDVLYNGIMAHSPFESRSSPSNLLTMMLAQELAKRGFRHVDLTPGFDLWKEHFADKHDHVNLLSVYPDAFACAAARARSVGRAAVVAALRRLQIEPRQVRTWIRNTISGRWLRTRKPVTYRLDLGGDRKFDARAEHSRDRLEDLFTFAGDEAAARQRFLGEALDSLEDGRHIYTLVRNARLVHFAWLDPAPDEEGRTALIGGFASMGGGELGDDAIRNGLEQICADAAAVPSREHIYALVDPADRRHRAALESIGFRAFDEPVAPRSSTDAAGA